MAEWNLVASLLRNGVAVNLAELVDSLFLLPSLFLYRKKAEVDPFAVIVIFIDLQYIQVEGDCEFALRLCSDKEISDNLWRIDGKYIIKVCNLSTG